MTSRSLYALLLVLPLLLVCPCASGGQEKDSDTVYSGQWVFNPEANTITLRKSSSVKPLDAPDFKVEIEFSEEMLAGALPQVEVIDRDGKSIGASIVNPAMDESMTRFSAGIRMPPDAARGEYRLRIRAKDSAGNDLMPLGEEQETGNGPKENNRRLSRDRVVDITKPVGGVNFSRDESGSFLAPGAAKRETADTSHSISYEPQANTSPEGRETLKDGEFRVDFDRASLRIAIRANGARLDQLLLEVGKKSGVKVRLPASPLEEAVTCNIGMTDLESALRYIKSGIRFKEWYLEYALDVFNDTRKVTGIIADARVFRDGMEMPYEYHRTQEDRGKRLVWQEYLGLIDYERYHSELRRKIDLAPMLGKERVKTCEDARAHKNAAFSEEFIAHVCSVIETAPDKKGDYTLWAYADYKTAISGNTDRYGIQGLLVNQMSTNAPTEESSGMLVGVEKPFLALYTADLKRKFLKFDQKLTYGVRSPLLSTTGKYMVVYDYRENDGQYDGNTILVDDNGEIVLSIQRPRECGFENFYFPQHGDKYIAYTMVCSDKRTIAAYDFGNKAYLKNTTGDISLSDDRNTSLEIQLYENGGGLQVRTRELTIRDYTFRP